MKIFWNRLMIDLGINVSNLFFNVKRQENKLFVGFWKLTMEVFGLELWDLRVECIVMMERPSRTLKVKRVRSNICIADNF